ncbi:methyltransferase [Ramlibacter albus]|uniref:Tetratricopeptide repeat protein n=1 Tax=Ramlibacter albus TaxID=2079448 RepID=A0A923M966_9BURK|nr:methyltransferase [Ramlibacter albus]MBC5765069.1 tetratricopeptide repeat protein [Ramlibacter albus]
MADAAFEQARELFAQGVQHTEAGRLEEAERSFAAALALVPRRASTQSNLAVVRMRLGRAGEALPLLDDALELEPGNLDTLGLRALVLAEIGRHPEALAAFDRVLAARPEAGTLWMQRGTLLVEMGRPLEAAESYRKALAHGADPELAGYYLAALTGGETPPAPPRDYVEGLFDKYADDFEVNLVKDLRYQAPTVLANRLAAMQRRFANALDLGCGTGLCGRMAKPMMARLEGVDISARMLEKAAETRAYDSLVHADIVEFLRTAQGPYDLVISADVFIYVGALEEVFERVAACMAPGGVFCFSVEEPAEGEPALALRASRRYAHSQAYIRELADRNGFSLQGMQRAPIREDKHKPIAGLYFWLERAAP